MCRAVLAPLEMAVLVPGLYYNKGNAVDDQRNGNHDAVVQVGIHPIIKQNAHNARGNDGHHNFEPQLPGLLFLLVGLAWGEGIQLVKEQDDHRQNRSQLNHHVKHALEFLGHIQGDELVQKNQVAGGGNGQPLRHALHDAKENRFQ